MKYIYNQVNNPFEISTFEGDREIALANGYIEVSDEDYEKLQKHLLRWENGALVENTDYTADDGTEVGLILCGISREDKRELQQKFYEKGVKVQPVTYSELKDRNVDNIKFVLFANDKVEKELKERNANIRFFNKRSSTRICDDKWFAYEFLEDEGIPQPKTQLNKDGLTMPFVVKGRHGGKGQKVFLVNNLFDLYEAEEKCKTDVLYQEYIADSHGKDLCVYVIGGECVASMQRTNENGFLSHVGHGATAIPVELTAEQKALCGRIADELQMDYCSINILTDNDGKMYVCDVNSNAGTEVIKEVTGVDVLDKYIEYIIDETK